jgi:hypothetical protein
VVHDPLPRRLQRALLLRHSARQESFCRIEFRFKSARVILRRERGKKKERGKGFGALALCWWTGAAGGRNQAPRCAGGRDCVPGGSWFWAIPGCVVAEPGCGAGCRTEKQYVCVLSRGPWYRSLDKESRDGNGWFYRRMSFFFFFR